MNANAIVNVVREHKGQHIKACWQRPMRTRKEFSNFRVEKRTCAWVRAGINYANLASVRDGVESGEREEIQSLPWGEWSEFPFIITHNDVEYVRLYPSVFANLKTTVEYFIDGKPASEESVKPLCLASEFRERDEDPKCFTLKADCIVAIGD